MTNAPAHPEPEPVPAPDEDPPQPIPPPDPVPAPEPPHESTPHAGVDFIDAGPQAAEAAFPPAGAFDDRDTDEIAAVTDDRATDEIAAVTDDRATDEIAAVTDDRATDEIAAVTAPVPVTPEMSATTVWRQPPASEPFHARHEKPGEWRFDPPEHLAYQHSPPAEVHDPSRMLPPATPAWSVPLTAGDADRRRRSGLWISVALTATLLICGGGAASAYVMLRDSDASGAPDPAGAVDEFMTAVYTRQDASAAEKLVCSEARDADKLAARVAQIKSYSTEYEAPSFRWADPAVDAQGDDRATVSVQLTMSTEDEKTAQQLLTFTTIRKSGWLVCEVSG